MQENKRTKIEDKLPSIEVLDKDFLSGNRGGDTDIRGNIAHDDRGGDKDESYECRGAKANAHDNTNYEHNVILPVISEDKVKDEEGINNTCQKERIKESMEFTEPRQKINDTISPINRNTNSWLRLRGLI